MNNRVERQGFLGDGSEHTLASATVAIVGLGGGGSHFAQQLAHLGIGRFVLFDLDRIEESNLNRMVGATERDVEVRAAKVDIAERVILGVNARAQIAKHQCRWQDAPESLHSADVVMGAVDSARGRAELEAESRRYLLPYVDIGLDVHTVEPEPPVMAGQVVLSMPGGPCMRCLGFLRDADLAAEALKYGQAVGGRPQVVWGNGVLASMAVGLVVDLLTGWTSSNSLPVYLSYEANRYSVTRHPSVVSSPEECTHFSPSQVGRPRYQPL